MMAPTTVAALMDDVTDPSDWHHDFTALRNLDACLRCDLCFDIYTSPVSIKSCNHTFCSACIRTHINQSGNTGSFCPKCRQTKAYDSELIPQPVLEVTALEWKKARAFLARLQDKPQQQQQQQQHQMASSSKRSPEPQPSTSTSTSPRRSKRIRTDAPAESSTGSRSSPLTILDDDDDDAIQDTTRRAPHDDDPDYIDDASHNRQLKADDLVQCPICSHKFTVSALDRHLDTITCKQGDPQPSLEERGLASKPAKPSSWFTPASTTADLGYNEKRLVRPQYNLRSERELRKLLDDAGLPTTGDRERLVERHRQWINLWNANLDSNKARRSTQQLRRELAAWERTKYSAKDHAAQVDKQKETWIKSNRSQFDELIQRAKAGAVKDKHIHQAPAISLAQDAPPEHHHDASAPTS